MFKELNVLEPFLDNPELEYHVRQIALILRISPATASSKLKHFAKQGLLVHRKERMLDLYKADIDSQVFRDVKTFFNIRKLWESGLIEELNRQYLRPTIILFGSARFGLDTASSDIDLCIISEVTTPFEGIKRFEKALNRGLQFLVDKKLSGISNKNLINSILNGIVLQGEAQWT